MKKINGTWFEFRHYGIPEGKYFNDAIYNFTDAMWQDKIKEIATLKMKYIVLMSSAYSDSKNATPETFYNSKYFKKTSLIKANDPIEDVLKEADNQNMKVFLSTGVFSPWDLPNESMKSFKTFEYASIAMKEMYELYKHHPSFYGWYIPEEAEIDKYFPDEFISHVNRFAKFIHSLDKNHKILVAPYGTSKALPDDYFVSQLKMLDVDYIAYQDEVGVKKTDENHTAKFYKELSDAHKKAGRSKIWADMEAFTFEGDVYKSALLPSSIERLENQLKAISPYVDEILIFEYQGMFNMPGSNSFCGHESSTKYYNDYLKLLEKLH